MEGCTAQKVQSTEKVIGWKGVGWKATGWKAVRQKDVGWQFGSLYGGKAVGVEVGDNSDNG